MAKSSQVKSVDDFNPVEVIKELSDNINQPDKFAELFCTAAKSQKKIDDVLKESIKNLMLADPDTKTWVQSMVREQNRKDLNSMLKKIAFSGWTLLVFILGSLFAAFCTAFYNKYFP